MKKFVLLTLSALAIVAMTGRSEAAVTFSADFNPAEDGIQSTVDASIGDRVTIDFVFDLTDTTSLSFWNFSVLFNTDNLAFVSREETPPPGASYVESDTANVNDLPNGLLHRFGFDTAVGPIAPFGPVKVGSATFDVIGLNTPASGFDVTVGDFDLPGIDEFLGNDFLPIDRSMVFFEGGSLSAVAIPEPSSMAIFGVLGVAGAYRVRRKMFKSKI